MLAWTAILYLSDVGGPTLVTNQRLSVHRAADRGWLAQPATNRIVLMDGRVLHGVLPTVHAQDHSQHRVTIMWAFWKRIRARNEETAGAARPFPRDSKWAKDLRAQLKTSKEKNDPLSFVPVEPVHVPHVYESLPDGEPWTRQKGMPNYEEIFQGV